MRERLAALRPLVHRTGFSERVRLLLVSASCPCRETAVP